jgi:hypothetical protein
MNYAEYQTVVNVRLTAHSSGLNVSSCSADIFFTLVFHILRVGHEACRVENLRVCGLFPRTVWLTAMPVATVTPRVPQAARLTDYGRDRLKVEKGDGFSDDDLAR